MSDLNILFILVPLIIIQIALFLTALVHIFKHEHYRIGNRIIWVIVIFINFIGPIAYFIFGRENNR